MHWQPQGYDSVMSPTPEELLHNKGVSLTNRTTSGVQPVEQHAE